MASFALTLLFATIMGLSIYFSLPIVLSKRVSENWTRLLNASAIGILVFLMGDVFSDAAPALYANAGLGYVSTAYGLDATFTFGLVAGFMVLYAAENRSRSGLTPTQMSLLIALGIGFQNLTEGLVFGSLNVVVGLTGVTLVVLVGFILQNTTEGFPIVSPFLGKTEGKTRVILLLLLVGGLPTTLGGAIGYYYTSNTFAELFDGLAIGAILYAILPMMKHMFAGMDRPAQRLVYLGIFIGFLVGFLVNLV